MKKIDHNDEDHEMLKNKKDIPDLSSLLEISSIGTSVEIVLFFQNRSIGTCV